MTLADIGRGDSAESAREGAGSLRTELARLVAQLPSGEARDRFAADMESFAGLAERFAAMHGPMDDAEWASLASPGPEHVVSYGDLAACGADEYRAADLARLAVLKLNGGLGTTMGCVGPKSAIAVRCGHTFLDMAVDHVAALNTRARGVPLVLMNSFSTDAETRAALRRHAGRVPLETVAQARYPRLLSDSGLPAARTPHDGDDREAWYPPGHGDLYATLHSSGLLGRLLAAGRDVLFVSNVDNLGASVDARVLRHVVESGADFVMEVTRRTRADVKGGALVHARGASGKGALRLVEVAQVPKEHAPEFASPERFRFFNTNNLWVNLRALRDLVAAGGPLALDVIANHKKHRGTGAPVTQLETAAGAAIALFPRALAVSVPRTRFLPVKTCSDLLLVRSALYRPRDGVLVPAADGAPLLTPVVKLGEGFRRVADFEARFPDGPPDIRELEHLTVAGDVRFGAGVVLRGTVIVVAHAGSRVDIPPGAILHDKVVTGNLHINDH